MPKDKYKASRYGGFDQGQSGRGQPTIAGRKARLKKISKKKRPAKYKKLMNKLAELRTKRSQTPKPPEKNLGVTTIDENNNETSSPGNRTAAGNASTAMSKGSKGISREYREVSGVVKKLKKKRKKRR